jgi:hypothetical protein
MRDGHLLKRGHGVREEPDLDGGGIRVTGCYLGRRNRPLPIGVMAFVGVCVAVLASIVTVVVLWSGAHDEPHLGGHDYSGSPPNSGEWPAGGGWDGGGGGDGGGWGG